MYKSRINRCVSSKKAQQPHRHMLSRLLMYSVACTVCGILSL